MYYVQPTPANTSFLIYLQLPYTHGHHGHPSQTAAPYVATAPLIGLVRVKGRVGLYVAGLIAAQRDALRVIL